ncbi:acetyltransferase [Desulfocapsa sulfexigens DSM 10523]|uniref:Acetyltransferase n=1 Tax=Desulfocapsa sulfexigens (strain DSM 10523 / SB164P1) TaxID=1167006 RepID=M1P647_DESSD|nr:N-acetyltransferase [Desulfocapsa sulfexigens]AGF77162.1 acetyltransferase [Desulfocapsa sulfexigens DSM 10523]
MTRIMAVTKEDIPGLCLLEEQLFTCDRISPRQFSYLISKANSVVIKAVCSEIFAGYMVLLRRRNSRRMRIYSLGVAPSVRRLGVAAEMLAFAEDIAAKHNCNCLSLEVSKHNDAALRFYKNAGFLYYGEKQKFYEDGTTALLLKKNIPERETQP